MGAVMPHPRFSLCWTTGRHWCRRSRKVRREIGTGSCRWMV